MLLLRTFLILIVIICPVFLQAAEISEDLQTQMQASQSDQLIQVWIELPKVVHGKQIAALASAMPTRAERYKTVLHTLKDSHSNSQKSVLGYLHSLPNSQNRNIKPHWMVNLIEAELTTKEIEAVAKRDDVKKIQTVPQLVTIEPEVSQKNTSSFSAGIELNLTYINAPAAWGMGYTGVGSVVCSFDTGVDGEHPALKHSWKGLDGDSLAAWFDPTTNILAPHYFVSCSGPNCSFHGTHTMGIMVGIDTLSGNTVGVAPGAKWISAAVLDVWGSLIDGFEWAADPDRNPNTIDDVPDVINHSWGVPGVECVNLYYDLIDNSEALGIVNIFAAGNGGSGSYTITNPANRANDSLDCFAVGNINHEYSIVEGTSSRGPSACPLGKIKPNVSAPGAGIRSTYPNGAYGVLSGTSMAAPHVSGLVALLRQKNPNATVDEIKTAILTSAIDMGMPGADNDYGWGRIDCAEALNNLSSVNEEPNLSLYSFDHPQISAGDTVIGTIVLQNSGATESSVTAIIVGANPDLEILAGSASFGTIAEGDTVRAGSPFEVVIAETVIGGTFLSIDLELEGDEFIDTVKLFFAVEPRTTRSFVTHDVGNIDFSISDFGTFGFGPDALFRIVGGSGFCYKGSSNDLYEGGLLIGQSFMNVSDGVRNVSSEPDGDFQAMPSSNILFVNPKLGVSQQTYSKFSDVRAENPIGLKIEQKSYAFDYVPYQDFIILQYLITNRSGGTLNNLYVGVFMDWDVSVWSANSGGYEPADEFSWVAHRISSVTLSDFRGMKVLQPGIVGSYTEISDSVSFGNPPVNGFTDLEKIQALASDLLEPEMFNDTSRDLVQMISTKITLADNQTDTVAFAILAGDSFEAIQITAMFASEAYSGVVTDIDDISGPGGLPQSFVLQQNYPNPFNPTTSIQFELPTRTEYRIEIFNLVGQKLFEKKETANAGRHSFVWDASKFASGVYLYKMTAGSFSNSKKMLLLK